MVDYISRSCGSFGRDFDVVSFNFNSKISVKRAISSWLQRNALNHAQKVVKIYTSVGTANAQNELESSLIPYVRRSCIDPLVSSYKNTLNAKHLLKIG